MDKIIIREFRSGDRDYVRRIASATAFVDRDKIRYFFDEEVLADALTIYFTDYEPESCFVAESDNKVIGYILGTKDSCKMDRVSMRKIIPKLFFKSLTRGVFFDFRNLKLFLSIMLSLLKGEFFSPDFRPEFPALLHINLDKDFRGTHIGSELIRHFLKYLRGTGVTGVHLATFSPGAYIFFKKAGFNLLFQGKRSYLRPYIGRDLDFYIFGMKL
jgi:GNAT superfamily N-acetyltransferase